ncbi:MAG: AAA family ATPase, partial [Clostridia bacterium]|nr:AAA family ATPase [Clostridia bacterium]
MNPSELLLKIRANIGQVLVGKQSAIDLLIIALLCRGHCLVEDVPGVGKTTLAHAFARSLGLLFQRIQFTPDVLPSDITGYNVYDLKQGAMTFHPGAIMSQIILADEINRSSPKTQSSLLEAMQEGQVTVDGQTYPLPQPFMVLATQNPIEFSGT